MKKIIILAAILLFTNNTYAASGDCDEAVNTYHIVACMSEDLSRQEEVFERYLNEAFTKLRSDEYIDGKTAIKSLKESNEHWLKSSKEYCDAVYSATDGSSQDISFLECMLEMYKARTHMVWLDFIRGHPQMDYESALDEPQRPELPSYLPKKLMRGIAQ